MQVKKTHKNFIPKNLAGKIPASSVDEGSAHIITKCLSDTFYTAKNLKYPVGKQDPLPWEQNPNCLLYANENEFLKREKEVILALLNDGSDDNLPYFGNRKFDKDPIYGKKAIKAFFNGTNKPADETLKQRLYEINIKLFMDAEQSNYSSVLSDFIKGGSPGQYYCRALWVTRRTIEMKTEGGGFYYDDEADQIIAKALADDDKTAETDAGFKEELHYNRSLIQYFPYLANGLVLDVFLSPYRKRTFLEYLANYIPKTDEEVFLFHKYVVLGKSLDFGVDYKGDDSFKLPNELHKLFKEYLDVDFKKAIGGGGGAKKKPEIKKEKVEGLRGGGGMEEGMGEGELIQEDVDDDALNLFLQLNPDFKGISRKAQEAMYWQWMNTSGETDINIEEAFENLKKEKSPEQIEKENAAIREREDKQEMKRLLAEKEYELRLYHMTPDQLVQEQERVRLQKLKDELVQRREELLMEQTIQIAREFEKEGVYIPKNMLAPIGGKPLPEIQSSSSSSSNASNVLQIGPGSNGGKTEELGEAEAEEIERQLAVKANEQKLEEIEKEVQMAAKKKQRSELVEKAKQLNETINNLNQLATFAENTYPQLDTKKAMDFLRNNEDAIERLKVKVKSIQVEGTEKEKDKVNVLNTLDQWSDFFRTEKQKHYSALKEEEKLQQQQQQKPVVVGRTTQQKEEVIQSQRKALKELNELANRLQKLPPSAETKKELNNLVSLSDQIINEMTFGSGEKVTQKEIQQLENKRSGLKHQVEQLEMDLRNEGVKLTASIKNDVDLVGKAGVASFRDTKKSPNEKLKDIQESNYRLNRYLDQLDQIPFPEQRPVIETVKQKIKTELEYNRTNADRLKKDYPATTAAVAPGVIGKPVEPTIKEAMNRKTVKEAMNWKTVKAFQQEVEPLLSVYSNRGNRKMVPEPIFEYDTPEGTKHLYVDPEDLASPQKVQQIKEFVLKLEKEGKGTANVGALGRTEEEEIARRYTPNVLATPEGKNLLLQDLHPFVSDKNQKGVTPIYTVNANLGGFTIYLKDSWATNPAAMKKVEKVLQRLKKYNRGGNYYEGIRKFEKLAHLFPESALEY